VADLCSFSYMANGQSSGLIVNLVLSNSTARMRWTKVLLCMAIFLIVVPSAMSQISPGKLTTAHESLEGITKCTQCHELGKAVNADKCLSCHSYLKSRIDSALGYHSSSDIEGESCTTCHSEHHGREYELIFWPAGQSEFEHAKAGWTLSGKHQQLDCARCHQPRFQRWSGLARDNSTNEESTFLGLNATCVSCHEDEHGTQLSDNCLTCHTESEWKPASGFDHQRDAEYALTGKHLEITCDKCHAEQNRDAADESLIVFADTQATFTKYQDLAYATCVACHKDPHTGRFGDDCSRCHTTEGFHSATTSGEFDHSKTNFPLLGLHQQVECQRCHTSGKMTDPVAHESCTSCHVDQHQGQFALRTDGGRCDACHTVERPFRRHGFGTADHELTDYPLTGSHLAIPCGLCHVPETSESGESYTQFTFADTRCQSCHQDEHRGQLDIWIEKNGCEFCHSTETWHRTSFDHNLARFALEGRHREILCLKCHWIETDTGEELVWMKPLDMNCAGCHEEPHGGQFSNAGHELTCETCHQSQGWNALTFSHQQNTNFPLTGGHENVACAQCHLAEMQGGTAIVQYRGVSIDCKACHGANPAHPGRG
jgi:hypothetical protein